VTCLKTAADRLIIQPAESANYCWSTVCIEFLYLLQSLEKAEELKAEGNELYKDGQLLEALVRPAHPHRKNNQILLIYNFKKSLMKLK
jgi:hypothetical protein